MFFFLFSIQIEGQENSVYVPKNIEHYEDYLERINDAIKKRIKGENASRIKKVFDDRDERIVKHIKDSAYVFNAEFNAYIDGLLNEIYSANPTVQHDDHKFFIKNSIVPNATCYGDGMFEIYYGLLETLDSDDEIAFVICHEIAHKILDHPLNNITNWVAKVNSKETKQKVRAIKRQRYGRTRKALSVIDDINTDMINHSKVVEAQADSLGLVLLKNTMYNASKSLTSLKKLELVDEMLLSHKVKIDSVFNFETYSFKSYWLKEEVSLFDTDEVINEYELSSDTLKTHPEVPYRIQKLKNEFKLDTLNFENKGNKLEGLITNIHNQGIQMYIDLKQLDFALYQIEKKHALKLISSDMYAEKMLYVLRQVYNAKKRHELGKYVPQKNGLSKEKELNTIRLFLHNLELKEIKKIGKAFSEKFKNNLKHSNTKEDILFFSN